MEDGTALGDVELPPWAKDDPQEFIRIQREVSDPDLTEAVRYYWPVWPFTQKDPSHKT